MSLLRPLELLANNLSYWSLHLYGARGWYDYDFQGVDPRRTPVVLIHGFMGTRGALFLLEYRLRRVGFPVFSLSLGGLVNLGDIRKSAFLIHKKIERILSPGFFRKVDVVGHSMGGLIGLYYVKKLGGAGKVRKLVALGAPFGGTWLAYPGVVLMGSFAPSVWQLLPRSDFLAELALAPMPQDVEVHAIAATRDIICPASSARLVGAINHEVPCSHSELAVTRRVFEVILGILERSWRDGPDEATGSEDTGSEDRDNVIPLNSCRVG